MRKKYDDELIDFNKTTDNSFLDNNSILIAGATGLLGSYLVDLLMKYNEFYKGNIKIYALARNKKRAEEKFSDYLNNDLFTFIKHDISNKVNFDFNVDYILHAASNSTPKKFSSDPIGTIKANIHGTFNLLDYAKKTNIKKMIFTSSSEVYGEIPNKEIVFDEKKMGIVDPLKSRSSYTESKRMAENILINYFKYFDIPINIARICFVYGPTFSNNDNRVIPQFLNKAMNNQNIILKSTGELVRSYAYIYDVMSALLTIMETGEVGETYNISNKNSNVSIKEIAKIIADIKNVDIVFDLPKEKQNKGYSPFSRSLLDSNKLEELGWNPVFDMEKGLKRTINILSDVNE